MVQINLSLYYFKKIHFHQTTFYDFNQSCGMELASENEWCRLGDRIAWNELEETYSHEEYARTWPGIHDPVEQAVRWYYLARQSFGGLFGKSWGTSVNQSSAGMSSQTAQWISSFDNLPMVHRRMQRVQLECCDWRDVLTRFSGPGWHTAILLMCSARARPAVTNTSCAIRTTRL